MIHVVLMFKLLKILIKKNIKLYIIAKRTYLHSKQRSLESQMQIYLSFKNKAMVAYKYIYLCAIILHK